MNIIATHKDVRDIIQPGDIKLIWLHLEKVFQLNVNIYQEQYRKYKLTHSDEPGNAAFVDFGGDVIEPVLNKMIGRDATYPTWNNLLRFLLKDKLAESSEQLLYYRSGAWKSYTSGPYTIDRYISI